jgi:hypothetical protein
MGSIWEAKWDTNHEYIAILDHNKTIYSLFDELYKINSLK